MKKRFEKIPVALTIAGSDSGGGAGIQADLRTFHAIAVHGCTAITAITAQNPFGVTAVQGVSPEVLRAQLTQIADAFDVGAVKTGMLLNAELIEVVAEGLNLFPNALVVVDPVMVATSGARLLDEAAEEALCTRLLPHASLITPNLPEAAALLGVPEIRTEAQQRKAALALVERFETQILLKGGHSAKTTSKDWLATPPGILLSLTGPRIKRPLTTHGTGCTLSAAIAGHLAAGATMLMAVRLAKAYVTSLLSGGVSAGKAAVYGHEGRNYTAEDIDIEPVVC